MMRVADGESRVLAAVREGLRQGASQIKLMGGGGVASPNDPLYTLQFTPQELRAAVTAAEDYGTYVATHVYSVAGIERAIDAGVKSIEHGHLAGRADRVPRPYPQRAWQLKPVCVAHSSKHRRPESYAAARAAGCLTHTGTSMLLCGREP